MFKFKKVNHEPTQRCKLYPIKSITVRQGIRDFITTEMINKVIGNYYNIVGKNNVLINFNVDIMTHGIEKTITTRIVCSAVEGALYILDLLEINNI